MCGWGCTALRVTAALPVLRGAPSPETALCHCSAVGPAAPHAGEVGSYIWMQVPMLLPSSIFPKGGNWVWKKGEEAFCSETVALGWWGVVWAHPKHSHSCSSCPRCSQALSGFEGCSVLWVMNAQRPHSGNGAGEDMRDRGFISRKLRSVMAREFSMINVFVCAGAGNLLNVGSSFLQHQVSREGKSLRARKGRGAGNCIPRDRLRGSAELSCSCLGARGGDGR